MNVFLLKIIHFEDIFRFHSKCPFLFLQTYLPLIYQFKNFKNLVLMLYRTAHTQRQQQNITQSYCSSSPTKNHLHFQGLQVETMLLLSGLFTPNLNTQR